MHIFLSWCNAFKGKREGWKEEKGKSMNLVGGWARMGCAGRELGCW